MPVNVDFSFSNYSALQLCQNNQLTLFEIWILGFGPVASRKKDAEDFQV
jgi:hypothetical protein